MPQSPPETRASLLLRLKDAADNAAWDEFVDLYGPVVLGVARRRGFQTADAENLVQEVFLAVAKSLPKWIDRQGHGSFRAWLLTIAHNEAIDMLTERATRSLGQDGEQGKRLLEEQTVRDDISALVEHEYELAIFRHAAEQVQQSVAKQTWLAFFLTEIEGKSVSQVAKELDTGEGSIYVARSRVMARIKSFVKDFEAKA